MTKLIGICGKAGVGKSTLAKSLQLVLTERGYKTAVTPLAETIKNILSYCEQYNPKSLRGAYENLDVPGLNGKALDQLLKQVIALYEQYPSRIGEKNRRFLQYIGTELGRNVLGNDVWVNDTIKRAKQLRLDVAIVDDVRFFNEVMRMDFVVNIDYRLAYDEWLQVCDKKGYSTSDSHVSEQFNLMEYANVVMKPYSNPQETINKVVDYVCTVSTV